MRPHVPADSDPIDIRPIDASSAGEILTLQRAAYVTEAQLNDDLQLPALTQTLPDLVEELRRSRGLGGFAGNRLVGAVRIHRDGPDLRIGRLTVVPDLQGHGIGTALLRAAEAVDADAVEPPTAARLFTSERSAANLRLYRRCGYVEDHRESLTPDITLMHLVKLLR